MRTAGEKITRGKLLSVAIAKVMYCDQEGEHSKHELIVALCEKYLDEAIAHGMTLAAEIAAEWNRNPRPIQTSPARDIRFQRDNKVWRKE